MSAGKGMEKMSAHVGPNMTPMVDVVMCILIFFMLSMTFANPDVYLTNNTPPAKEGLGQKKLGDDVKFPSVTKRLDMVTMVDTSRGSAKPVTYVKAFDGTLKGIDQGPKKAEITDFLRVQHNHLSNDVKLIIAPEKNVPYQDVISLYEACIAAGFQQVAFAQAK